MKLKSGTIYKLAEMICGSTAGFTYRTGSDLNRFFVYCNVDFQLGSRFPSTLGALTESNEGEAWSSELPSDAMVRIIQSLIDPTEFARLEKDVGIALSTMNDVLKLEGLEAYLDGSNTCQLRKGDLSTITAKPQTPGLSPQELARKAAWEEYLEGASEDAFTENVLLPLLHHGGFQRVSSAGHEDKALEYGRDVWMKLRLPTGHWIYFGVQVKKGKLDSAGRSQGENENIAEVLHQVKMALATEVFDPDINKKVLVDHMYVVASGGITKAARNLIAGRLDLESRRQLIFMDRDDVLTLVAKSDMRAPSVLD